MFSLRSTVAVIITVVWALMYLVALFKPNVIPLVNAVSPIMLVMVTWLFAVQALANRNKDDKDDQGKK